MNFTFIDEKQMISIFFSLWDRIRSDIVITFMKSVFDVQQSEMTAYAQA